MNDLDILFAPLEGPESIVHFIVHMSPTRSDLRRIKKLRPSIGRELSEVWSGRGTWTEGPRKALSYLGCRFDDDKRFCQMLPWREHVTSRGKKR